MYTGNTQVQQLLFPMFSVYPCVYREHAANGVPDKPMTGLSLCIQGTHLCHTGENPLDRFIPVYTGNTCSNSSALIECAVYPCVYREHCYYQLISHRNLGLSLCIQGTRAVIRNQLVYLTVYPCVYREHIYVKTSEQCLIGLSLCIQGTRYVLFPARQGSRFIPVYTGNTKLSLVSTGVFAVYPCVYREHSNYNLLFIN